MPLAGEALPDGRVLGVDGPQPGQRRWPSASPGRVGRDRGRASARASGMTRWPPATSVSLLAVATTLPARSAASTGRRLTTPPVATMTRSTSSRVGHRDQRVRIARRRPSPRAGRASRAPPGRPARRPRAGPSRPARRSVAASRARPPGPRPRKASGPALVSTSSVWRPMEPVEPSSATPIGRGRQPQRRQGPRMIRKRRRRAPRRGTSRRGRGCRRGRG